MKYLESNATALALLLMTATLAHSHEPLTRFRSPVRLPEIPGYVTLRCDFHIHTVFSDGAVWPSVRSEEAWRHGLDAIAITDHIEYQPHTADMVKNHNRSYAIAREAGEDLSLIVVAGSEITRSMPPGHLNAIFLTNAAPLETKEWRDAVGAAHAQGAFIFWNHPGWPPQLDEGKVVWHPEHSDLLEKGELHGIEVVNGRSYYPEAHQWAVEKNLAMLSNSDIHAPINLDYNVHDGDPRPITLVFARERGAASLKEALFARRTVVLSGDRLIGPEQFVRPIVERSIRLDREKVEVKGRKAVSVQISNESDIQHTLQIATEPAGYSAPNQLILPPGKTVLLTLQAEAASKDAPSAPLEYNVTNALIGPGKPLKIRLPLEVQLGK
jgi:hypothetical protein